MVRRLHIPAQTDAIHLIDQVLSDAISRSASDIHIEPTAQFTEVRLRVDGLLELHSRHDPAVGRSLVSRLMVMAHLLTYRLDIPQEGRLRIDAPAMELRLAVIPTTHGLRAAVRLPAELVQPRSLDDLGLPSPVLSALKNFATVDSGMLLLVGPAGSGKTTTIYALLEYMSQKNSGQSIISLEDPVERDLPGVTQIEITPFGQMTYEKALRSVMRQDPQVLMLGEIRDAQTASLAAQAALSGHKLVCTLHAASPGGAISRLLEMGLEPYRITSSLFGVITQRLFRRFEGENYRGRIPAAEFVGMSPAIRSAILARADADELQRIASQQPDHTSLRDSAHSLVAQQLTNLAELERIFGSSQP